MESTKAGKEAFCHLTEFSNEVCSLKWQMRECIESRDDAASLATEHNRQSRMLKDGVCLLKDKLVLLLKIESTGFNIKIMCHKVADAENKMNNLGDGLHIVAVGR